MRDFEKEFYTTKCMHCDHVNITFDRTSTDKKKQVDCYVYKKTECYELFLESRLISEKESREKAENERDSETKWAKEYHDKWQKAEKKLGKIDNKWEDGYHAGITHAQERIDNKNNKEFNSVMEFSKKLNKLKAYNTELEKDLESVRSAVDEEINIQKQIKNDKTKWGITRGVANEKIEILNKIKSLIG